MKTTNVYKLAAGLLLSASFLLGPATQAAPPTSFGIQGQLLDADGVVVADGAYDFLVALGDDSDDISTATVFWPAQDPEVEGPEALVIEDVAVVNGVYNFSVDGVPADVLIDNDVYLWMAVEGEILGRTEIEAVPYALVAGTSTVAVTANSVADGSITTESLADGAVTAMKIAAGTIGDVVVDEETGITLAQTIDTVSSIRDVVKPVAPVGTQEYVVIAGHVINKVNPFGVSSAVFYNDVGGGTAPGSEPTINVTGLAGTGLTFNTANNTLTGTPVSSSSPSVVYPIQIVITDFLGQETTFDANLTIITAEFTALVGTVDGGAAITGANVQAGDVISISFNSYVDKDVIPANLVASPLSLVEIDWNAPEADFDKSVTGSDTSSNVTPFGGVRKFTTNLVGNKNDEGNYVATITASFDQLVPVGTYNLGTINKTLSIATWTYAGNGVDNLTDIVVDAGEDSGTFLVEIAGVPTNGTAQFAWYKTLDATPDAANDLTSQVASLIVSDSDSSTLILEDIIQGLQGKAYQNQEVELDAEEAQTYYFPVVQTAFEDAAPVDAAKFSTNDNVNVAIYPQPRLEFGGYPATYAVVAGTTNGTGTIEFQWVRKNEGTATSASLSSTTNSVTIPAAEVIDIFNDVDVDVPAITVLGAAGDFADDGDDTTYDYPFSAGEKADLIAKATAATAGVDGTDYSDYTIWNVLTIMDGDTFISRENTSLDNRSAPLIVLPAVLEVPANIDVTDADGAVVELGGGGFFGIADPQDNGDALVETVESGEDVSFQALFMVPASLLSAADNGAFVDFATGPGISLTVNWYIDQDGGTDDKDLALPPSTISYVQVDADGADRVGILSQITLENVQNNDNNDANGTYFAEVVTPYGNYTTGGTVLTVNPAP